MGQTSISFKSRLQDLLVHVRQVSKFKINDAVNIAEDIGELLHEDVITLSEEQDQNHNESSLLHYLYDEVYLYLKDDESNHDRQLEERINLILQKLHFLLFGPVSSPILALEKLMQEAKEMNVVAQTNSLLRIITGLPNQIHYIAQSQSIKATWFYPKPLNGLLLGGDVLHSKIMIALLQGGFMVQSLVSKYNQRLYYQIDLFCQKSDLPFKRQYEAPSLYEQETNENIFNKMF